MFTINGAMESPFSANARIKELKVAPIMQFSASLGFGMNGYFKKLSMSAYFEGSLLSFGNKTDAEPGYQRITRVGIDYRYLIFEKKKISFALGAAYQNGHFWVQLNSSPTQVDFSQDPFSGNGRLLIENRQDYLGPSLMIKLQPEKDYGAHLVVSYLFGISKRTWTSGGDLVVGLPQERLNTMNLRICFPFIVAYKGQKGLNLKSEE